MTDTVSVTTAESGLSVTASESGVAVTASESTVAAQLTSITETPLIVPAGETFTAPAGETVRRTYADIDGTVTVNGELQLTD